MIRIVSCCPVWKTYVMPPMGDELRTYLGTNIDYQSFFTNICGYNLLYHTLKACELPYSDVTFGENGKPYFREGNLFFCISGTLRSVAVSISDAPTSVVMLRDKTRYTADMYETVLSPEEKRRFQGDFYEVSLRKAAVRKLVGAEIYPELQMVDSEDPRVTFFHARPRLRTGSFRLVAAFARMPDAQPDTRVTYLRTPV